MSGSRALMLAGLSGLALALSACGAVTVKPKGAFASRGVVDDPRTAGADRIGCLRADKFAVQLVGNTDVVINGNVRVHFDATIGASQWDQIRNTPGSQGAEVIGAALVYPGNAPDSELGPIEACMALGVKG
jgi:hypothetical protein